MNRFLGVFGWSLALHAIGILAAFALPVHAQQPAAAPSGAQPAPSGLTPLPPISEPPGTAPQPAAPVTQPLPPPNTPASANAAPATGTATAVAQPGAAGTATASTGVRLGGAAAIDDEVPPVESGDAQIDPELDETLRFRLQNTWLGPTGGLHVVDAMAGPAGTARLQFAFDYFSKDDFLFTLDHNAWLGGVLSLSVTPIEHLEAYASLSTHANRNDAGDPELLQVAGDVVIGAKGFTQVLPWLSLGGDLRFLFLNTIGDVGVILKGTSVGIRGLGTADLRRLPEPVPLLVRANLEYLLDNSHALVDGVERARYNALPELSRRSFANEDQNLVNRVERFALGINRVDMFSISLGFEAPLKASEDFFIQPLLEWRLGIPVNRQGYSCLSVETNAGIDGADSCLAIEGLSAAPSTLTIGARVLPPVRGLSALLAFDIGLLGVSTFVRELAPNRPWAVMFAVGYAFDLRAPKPVVQYVSTPAPTPIEKARVRGTAVERGFGTPIVGAIVRYPDLDFSPQLTNASGQWVSYQLDPGEVIIEVTHPDYDSARCIAKVPAAPPPGAASPLQPYAGAPVASSPAGAPAQPGVPPPPAAAKAAPALVEVRCELTAHPRSGAVRGSVMDDKSAALPGVTVEITGPSPQTVVTDAGGTFSLSGLPVGEYFARVDVPAYLLKTQQFSVTSGGEASLPLMLVPKPKEAQVTLTAKEVKIRQQIMFKTGSAEIDAERSTTLLSEIADVLLRNPQAAHVQVQGHTDNVGDPEANLTLSQQRAESVVQWLVSAGVGADRLEAKGYGDARPLVPNLTPGNRAQNRRVQFIVKDAAAP